MAKKFEASFESLREYQCPDWFRDAKFGIWSHWGPQSVSMYGDWYARNMYIQGSDQYRYHIRHYGHPSKFGYKDICALWKAENFDPDALMDLYVKAGARYFVGQAMHHDHFFNYPSQLNRFNSMQVGPHKDICGLWKAAADKHGLPFGLTEHLGASSPGGTRTKATIPGARTKMFPTTATTRPIRISTTQTRSTATWSRAALTRTAGTPPTRNSGNTGLPL